MAKTAQEKLDAKREKEYNKKHKRMYRRSVGDVVVGYLVTKQEMWHRSLWYRFLVITMYFNAGLIPTYLNLVMLGLTNNYWVYIIPGIVAPYNIILVKTYIESIPGELEESAFIDGASYMVVFR